MGKGDYRPDIAIHPGETLIETIEAFGMTQAEVAGRTGLAPKTINEIVKGKNPITPDTAMKFSAVFGTSASFWNNLQKNYEETIMRLMEEKALEAELPLLEEVTCYPELVKYGYIEKAQDPKERAANLLKFFAVGSLSRIPELEAVAFRGARGEGVNPYCVAAWLRCGEIEARNIKTKAFNKEKLTESLSEFRSMTKQDPHQFEKRLIEMCSECGIAAVFVPHFKNTKVNGATRWMNAETAIVQLSLRYKWSDIFWFTFFHELGHIIKHGKKDQFIEFKDNKNEGKEKEADEFAKNTLIQREKYRQFTETGDFSAITIKSFAEREGISPDIVAGRLSHDYGDWRSWSYLRRRKFEFVKTSG
jgi:HTH-type transcriptional regulator / antitoxin HigA